MIEERLGDPAASCAAANVLRRSTDVLVYVAAEQGSEQAQQSQSRAVFEVLRHIPGELGNEMLICFAARQKRVWTAVF